jgi:hypothetical protein
MWYGIVKGKEKDNFTCGKGVSEREKTVGKGVFLQVYLIIGLDFI